MARINKANNDGSISIIIPKSIRKINNWIPGQNVDIIAVNPACILLKNTDSRHQFSKIEDIEELMAHINSSMEGLKEMYELLAKEIPEKTTLKMDEEQFRGMLRQYLIGLLERI